MGLTWGIYPGRTSNNISDAPEHAEQIKNNLKLLKQGKEFFLVRGYIHYTGTLRIEKELPEHMILYAYGGIKIDLVLCYRSETGEVENWKVFICNVIQKFGPHLAKLQITEEPNNPDPSTGGDGKSPLIIQAIIEGVLAAKKEIKRLGLSIDVGFNAVVSFKPSDPFWSSLSSKCTDEFLHSLDYVGLDFFPDVFSPLPTKPDGNPLTIEEATSAVISQFRRVNLATINIPITTPIHITENGWATNPSRSYGRQAEVLMQTVQTIAYMGNAMNITHYEYFALRDANSSSTELQFGLLRDDYTPKPAFNIFCDLIKAY